MTVKDYRILLSQEKGFKQVFESFYPRLLRFAIEYVKDKREAENILQDVFLTLWEKRNSLKTDTNLTAYLLTLVKSQCLNYLKHKRVVEAYSKKTQTTNEQETIFNYYAISKFNPEQIDIESLELLVEKAISELPDQCRKVFELSRYDGLKYKEIAEKLNISVKTVETHMSNALKILRLNLKDSFLIWLFYQMNNF